MTRMLVIGGCLFLLLLAAAALVPTGMMLAGMTLSGHGYAAVFLMVFFSFAVAGGLMFLIFYSARHGYDDAAHHGGKPDDHDRA
jgi:hypothetical protein